MSTFSKVLLSGSTDGKPIHVTASGTPGNIIHTSVASPSLDEVWLYAMNKTAVTVNLTLEYGDSACIVAAGVPSLDGLHLIVPGFPLNNSEIIRAFATASGIDVYGFINRIT